MLLLLLLLLLLLYKKKLFFKERKNFGPEIEIVFLFSQVSLFIIAWLTSWDAYNKTFWVRNYALVSKQKKINCQSKLIIVLSISLQQLIAAIPDIACCVLVSKNLFFY